MLGKISEILGRWSTEGMHWPFVKDSTSGKPSITLLMFYTTFTLSMISLVALHLNPNFFVASSTCLLAWGMSFVFYRMRHLDKVKFDLDDKSIELSDEPSNVGEKTDD